MTFANFSLHLAELESTSSRLEMTRLLSKLYLELADDERAPASYLLLGSLVPPYQSLEFQLSVKMVIRTLANMDVAVTQLKAEGRYQGEQDGLFGSDDSSAAVQAITDLYKELGDLGETAQHLLAQNTSAGLSVRAVYDALVQIAREQGAGSQDRKLAGLRELLIQLEPLAAKYVARMILGKLRLGFSTMTILDALSWAVRGDKSDHDALEEAYQKQADVGELARAYLHDAVSVPTQQRLQQYSVRVGVPIIPALCQRLNSAQEIIETMGEVIAEPKYDGLRAQIHFRKDPTLPTGYHIEAYTRSLENVTHMYPELSVVAQSLRCESCILDAEAIGYVPGSDELQNFQATITRKRKHAIEEVAQEVPIRFCVFDVVERDGQSLLNTPLDERKQVLRALFDDSPTLIMTPFIVTNDAGELREYHEQLIQDGLEGAVIKKLHSTYAGGRKGWRWVKIKEIEGTTGKLADTLDVVVMGYYVGRGKRNAFGIGAFLVGVLEVNEQNASGWSVKTIAKIGTGLTDDQFREMKRRCDEVRVDHQPAEFVVPGALRPDVWTAARVVVEVAADELTISPVHSAGFALRFPRLVDFRDDKSWQQATTTSELAQIGRLSD